MIIIPDAMRRPAEVEREELRKQLSEARAENAKLRKLLATRIEATRLDEAVDQLADARAEIERLKMPTSTENLDERMKAAGMMTVAEIVEGTLLDEFCAHAGVNNMQRFEEWLLMRRKEFLTIQATMQLNKEESDDLYEWVIAHSAVFAEALANFRQAKPDIERKGKLIEQMREALKWALPWARTDHSINVIKAALSAAERGEVI